MHWYLQLGIGILVAIGVLAFGLFIASPVMQTTIEDQLVYTNCCNGSICTDVYYKQESNTCHLVLCEIMPFANCTYTGLNKTLNLTLLSQVP